MNDRTFSRNPRKQGKSHHHDQSTHKAGQNDTDKDKDTNAASKHNSQQSAPLKSKYLTITKHEYLQFTYLRHIEPVFLL